jgi:hypothetical protein
MKPNTYFQTYCSAVLHAYSEVSKDYKIDELDWFQKVSIYHRPDVGKTKDIQCLVLKDKITGAISPKTLSIQVYNTGSSYELNYYVS